MDPSDMSRMERLRQRFWQRVTKSDGCWEHSGSLGSHGYPQATTPDRVSYPAHRVYWLLFVGDIGEGMFVCHRCNNKKCVRPDHLYLGTHKQNMDDMARAGHPRRALTDAQVRRARTESTSTRSLAREFGVSQKVVQLVRKQVTYRHVPM